MYLAKGSWDTYACLQVSEFTFRRTHPGSDSNKKSLAVLANGRNEILQSVALRGPEQASNGQNGQRKRELKGVRYGDTGLSTTGYYL